MTKNPWCRLASILPFLALALAPIRAFALQAGVAACDITPDVQRLKVPMAGYGARNGKPSTGVHDPLSAKVLYLVNGDVRMALVTTDLRSMSPELKNKVIEKAKDSGLTRENLLICASHTHDGPSFYPQKFWQLQFGTSDPEIVETISSQIAEAIVKAKSSLFEARVGSAETMLEGFTHNRRWNDDLEARKAAGEKPQTHPRLFVLRVDDTNGKPRAILVNFATHPTILDADNFLISAEWPGVLQRKLEGSFAGAIAMFSNGAEGDQSPEGAQGADAFAKVENFGTRLAERAVELAKSISSKPGLKISSQHLDAPLGEPTFSEGSKKGKYAFMEPMAIEALPRTAEMQVLRIGDFALLGVPGEAICEVGVAAEEAMRAAGAPHPVVIGLANDYVGYIVNEKEYPHGGYEVDQRSYYGPTLGARIVKAAAEIAARPAKSPR